MTAAARDIALDALFHPFANGPLRWPGSGAVLFLRGREGAALHAMRGARVQATQPFKPEADRLQRIGIDLLDEEALPPAAFPLVLLPPRQREEARALLAVPARRWRRAASWSWRPATTRAQKPARPS